MFRLYTKPNPEIEEIKNKQYIIVTEIPYQVNKAQMIIKIAELIKDKKIYIGDNDLLKIHLLNSAIKMSTERGRGKLVKLSPSVHIDGTAALLDAMTVRQKYYAEIGAQLRNEKHGKL